MRRDRAVAFAPGRANLIGEHTDYNAGLALPFAILEGVAVHARAASDHRIHAFASDLGDEDSFDLGDRSAAHGWRAFVRGTIAELSDAGYPPVAAQLQIGGDLPWGAGLSSSAALEVSLCLALLSLSGHEVGEAPERIEVARLCARVENDWVGARTGLLDQMASLFGARDAALCIDFRTLEIERVPLDLGDWRLLLLDSGERHAHASSAYNDRRAECARAAALLGVPSLREATRDAVEQLDEPLRRRAIHVLGENDRVGQVVAALGNENLTAVGESLNASHASLRDCYEVSTPAVEATVDRMLRAGAAGARMIGGGFGGCVLGLFAPGVQPPAAAREVRPGPGAYVRWA